MKDFFRSRHHEQIKRREAFQTSVTILITGQSIVGGMIGYMAISYTAVGGAIDNFFWIMIALSSISFIVSIYFHFRSYLAPRLIDIASTNSWLSYINNDIKAIFKGQNDEKKLTTDFFYSELIKAMAEAETINKKSNDWIGYSLENSRRALLVSLFIAILVSPTAIFSIKS